MQEDVMLTTSDNPYDPFTQFDNWYSFDTEKGYNTCSLISRFAKTSINLTDEVNDELIDHAYNEIIHISPTVLGFKDVFYKKVSKQTKV
jgi:hypothetical protein